MCENMRIVDSATATCLALGIDVTGVFFACLYFLFVSKNWLYLYGGTTILTILATIALAL